MMARRTTSALLIGSSLTVATAGSVVLDLVVVSGATSFDAPPLALLLNGIALLQAGVGAVIEWRRPGHAIGRLLMLSGPIFAFLALGWSAGTVLMERVDPVVFPLLDWSVTVLSYPGMAIITGWLPLLFPTGTLPGPRWRLPVAVLLLTSTAGLLAVATRPGPMVEGGADNPFGIPGWPPVLQALVDSLLAQLAALAIMAVVGLAVRYRRGDQVERHQIRWLLGAVAVVACGFVATAAETAIRSDDGIALSLVVVFVGVLLMPLAIGIAILRYRLYEIDRIISRTIAYATVTAIIGVVFLAGILALQAVLADWTQGETLAVAVSTLGAFALFQPVRRRVQRAVDRRFNRARVDAERTTARFIGHLRDELILEHLVATLTQTADQVVEPRRASVWLRRHDTSTP